MKLTAIFFGDIRAIASGVIPPTCCCSRADSTMSGRPAGHRGREREKRYSEIINVSHVTSQEECRETFPLTSEPVPSGILLIVPIHPRAVISSLKRNNFFKKLIKKSLHPRDIMLYYTCQRPNFSENFWSPSINWTKGLWSGQTACQCLHLLLCAWQGCLPQEHNSHTAV